MMGKYGIRITVTILVCVILGLVISCSRLLGYGVLLWSVDAPEIPSGTVLPVYIKSNIDNVWVVGIPEEYRRGDGEQDKFELPLWQLDFMGSKKKAQDRSEEFTEFAAAYAETLQDGLPIRSQPDNSDNAERVYRLRQGQIVKVMDRAEGSIVMGADSPLPGEWLQVMTDDGVSGYCFSYRLRIFEHHGGSLAEAASVNEVQKEDPLLEALLSRTWLPEWYRDMVNQRRIDLEYFSERWGFFPTQDTGFVHLSLPDVDLAYQYTRIVPAGEKSWRFDGAPLQMTLRSDTVLAVEYIEEGGAVKTYIFTTLGADIPDLKNQEIERRAAEFNKILDVGSIYRSENYGVLTFSSQGGFSWMGYDLLVPTVVPKGLGGTGYVDMRLFLDASLQTLYDGAFTLRFKAAQGAPASELSLPGSSGEETALALGTIYSDKTVDIDFLYKLEPSGLRIEYVPSSGIDGVLVRQRTTAPIVVYFYSSER